MAREEYDSSLICHKRYQLVRGGACFFHALVICCCQAKIEQRHMNGLRSIYRKIKGLERLNVESVRRNSDGYGNCLAFPRV